NMTIGLTTAAIERRLNCATRERTMSQTAERHSKGVICLFCGNYAPLPARTAQRVESVPDSGYRGSIIRCESCGKEALYLGDEVVDFEALPSSEASGHHRTR